MAVTVRTLENFVGGEWVESTGHTTRQIVSAVSAEILAEAPNASADDIDRAGCGRARGPAALGCALGVGSRQGLPCDCRPDRRTARGVRARAVARAGQALRSRGARRHRRDGREVRIAAEDVKRMETAIVPSQDVGKRILTFWKPNGVYAGITPWDCPTLIPVELIAPGIAVGNTIVMKPSEWTPIAMANFMRIMADAGLPPGVVNVVYGAGEVGERLVTHPGVDCVGFVGSHGTRRRSSGPRV
jgi:acyl-CoA reductase-like NAD-dependent aldehyde dehydrogenase